MMARIEVGGGYAVETWLDRQVLVDTCARDDRVGRVVLMRGIAPDGRESWQEHSYWHHYGAPGAPLVRVTTRDLTAEQARAAVAKAQG
jgi:hypothetical protein